jgi:hypothetical protein
MCLTLHTPDIDPHLAQPFRSSAGRLRHGCTEQAEVDAHRDQPPAECAVLGVLVHGPHDSPNHGAHLEGRAACV